MIATFEAAGVETLVINAAGCRSTMKEYGHLLSDDPEWAARARHLPRGAKTSASSCMTKPSHRDHPCRFGSHTTMPAICVTHRAFTSNRVPCWPKSPHSQSRRFRKLASAVARRAYTTFCIQRPLMNSATTKYRTCFRPTPKPSSAQPRLPAAVDEWIASARA